jgi:hypothetical protein
MKWNVSYRNKIHLRFTFWQIVTEKQGSRFEKLQIWIRTAEY